MSELESTGQILDSKSEKVKKESLEGKSFKGQLGGARPGAGMPKGKKTKKTLEKLKVKSAFNQRVLKHADELFNAQYQLARGEQVLMVKITDKDSKGKVIRTYHEQVTDPETIKQFLDDESAMQDNETYYYLSTRSPNNQALEALLNRTFGKATDKVEIEGGSFFKAEKLIIEVVKGHTEEEDEPEETTTDEQTEA